MKLNSRKILIGANLLIVLILFGILIFKTISSSGDNKKDSTSAVNSTENGETTATETTPPETEPTETEATEPVTEAPVQNGISYSAEEISNYIRGKVPYTGEKLVFLTFDDGPNNDTTGRILDVLKEHGVKATFFLQGRNVTDSTAEVLKRIHAEGNCVGMHSYTHDYNYLYPDKVANPAAIVEEVQRTEAVFKKYLGEDFKPKTWRYPGGHMSWVALEEADSQLKAMGVEWIDWNAMNGDAEPKSRRPTTPEGLVQTVSSTLEHSPTKDIAVVLMHDGKSKELTVQTLPQIIQYFKDNGFKFAIFN
ncbi:polysaccharide deacetylase [Peptostreptococcaceae bacterium OttesenSCG-928-C18]|nr:polysaccharide deacetylase [Peptostreptococcaceae bacterium OttesenSCG-928-C18]